MEYIEANVAQRREIARMIQQKLRDLPKVKKLGGQTYALLLESTRFQFDQMPIKAHVFARNVELAGVDEEPQVEQFYRFKFKWQHPCLDFSIDMDLDLDVTTFEGIL